LYTAQGAFGELDDLTQERIVAVGQLRPKLGQVEENIQKHLELIEEANRKRADLVVFPELGLTGYQLQDLTLDVARPIDDGQIQRLIAASRSIDVSFSFVEESSDHRFYIASVYASMGEIIAVHRKVYLPTYGMFDEARYFAAGEDFHVARGQLGSVGTMICEDAWHVTSPYLLAQGGADILLLPASSPSRLGHEADTFGSHSFWKQLLRTYAQLFGVHIIFANRVGFEDGLGFFGGSMVTGPTGEILAEAPILEEHLIVANIDLSAVRRARFQTPILRDERPELVLRELDRLTRSRWGGSR
jgi:predicted amidohydrolase